MKHAILHSSDMGCWLMMCRTSRTFKWLAVGCGALGAALIVKQLLTGTVAGIRRRRLRCVNKAPQYVMSAKSTADPMAALSQQPIHVWQLCLPVIIC